jgi:hypothetical protein
MPISARPADQFTRDNLLLGFLVVSFQPALIGGGYGPAVPLGILSGEALQKGVETLALERGDSGPITVDREIISRFEAAFQLETFNFRYDLAQYIFGADTLTAVVADAAAAVTDEPFSIPSVNPFDSLVMLANASIDETTLEVTCGTVTNEAVGTGDGASGGIQGDFGLDFKIKAIGDVTGFTVGGVDESAKLVAGSTPGANEIAIETGEEDSLTTGSGAITFGASEIPANGAAIVATYTPSFSTTGTDIVNLTDFVFDPTLGQIRMLHAAADASPFRLAADSNQQPLEIDYNYNQKAGWNLQPFTQREFEGKASIQHLTDVGVNFDWDAPSVTIRLTDDDLTFGAEDFATATLRMNINDSGGATRYGTLFIADETQAGA